MKTYLDTIYDPNKKPITYVYPERLTKYLITRFNLNEGEKLMEPGYGRGEFLYQFSKKKFLCFGFDNSSFHNSMKFNAEIKNHDATILPWPYPDNYFDIIYNKSFIEHFYYPENLFSQFYRILKPGGKLICLTPDWETIYETFFEDFTHRTPFTKKSLEDINELSGFKNISVEKFLQLPLLWKNNYFLKLLSKLTKHFVPNYFIKKSKWVRFSKEVMLLSYSEK